MNTRDVLTSKRLRHLEAMITEISAGELNSKIIADEIFKLIEVSDKEDYEAGHLPHAEHIPMTELEFEAPTRFRKFQQIVLYAEEAASSVATAAAKKLQRLAFSNVMVLKDGKEGWKKTGYELVNEKSHEEA